MFIYNLYINKLLYKYDCLNDPKNKIGYTSLFPLFSCIQFPLGCQLCNLISNQLYHMIIIIYRTPNLSAFFLGGICMHSKCT